MLIASHDLTYRSHAYITLFCSGWYRYRRWAEPHEVICLWDIIFLRWPTSVKSNGLVTCRKLHVMYYQRVLWGTQYSSLSPLGLWHHISSFVPINCLQLMQNTYSSLNFTSTLRWVTPSHLLVTTVTFYHVPFVYCWGSVCWRMIQYNSW